MCLKQIVDKKGVEDLFDWEAIAKETTVTTEVGPLPLELML